MVLLQVATAEGTTRVCGARCHGASIDPKKAKRATCICGGVFRGIGAGNAQAVSTETLMKVREQMKLNDGDIVQLRLGA